MTKVKGPFKVELWQDVHGYWQANHGPVEAQGMSIEHALRALGEKLDIARRAQVGGSRQPVDRDEAEI